MRAELPVDPHGFDRYEIRTDQPKQMARSRRMSVTNALRTLQLNETRWQAVLDTAQDAIISVDRHGRITLFNRGAERIFGYSADELLGREVTMLMPAPYSDEHNKYLHEYQRTGIPKAIGRVRDVQARRKNGEIFPIELSVSEARLGRQLIYSAIIRDVTERRRAEEDLRTSNESLQREIERRIRTEAELREARSLAQQRERLADIGAITARIVHDLGNPLAAVSMQAQLILRRVERGDGIATVVGPAKRILSATQRLDVLVREFMDFAREQRLDLKAVHLPHFLSEIAALWEPVAAHREIALTLHLEKEACSLHADEEKLRRVLDNLVKNAVEAVDHGPGKIRIHASNPAPERVRISVEDTGPGIAKDVEVFRLFETTKPQGSGLGLAVARQIVMAHGGGISFAPLQPHGTVFHVELPRRGPAM